MSVKRWVSTQGILTLLLSTTHWTESTPKSEARLIFPMSELCEVVKKVVCE